MKNLKIILLVILMFCVQKLKSQNILHPENVFDLYFKSFVKYDDASVRELNSYLINFMGKDHTYKMSQKDSYDKKVDYFTQLFLSNLSAEVAQECKKEARDYFCVFWSNFKEAKYNIKNIKTVFNENMKDQEISEVNYTVSFKVPSHKMSINIGDIKKIGAGEMRKYLIDITDYFRKADKVVSTDQKFMMYQLKHGRDTYYWNGGPEELVWQQEEFYLKSIN
ncbi:hypothetical protein GCM10022217_36320 [Chryseobacterium ginsenosidimutans]|uniref:hypothetical protein n=1 Tax=Chryseobacterium ginsenosidimutans TaxID=687846 RepID=UPI0031CEB415